jgi:hypothetical protein
VLRVARPFSFYRALAAWGMPAAKLQKTNKKALRPFF